MIPTDRGEGVYRKICKFLHPIREPDKNIFVRNPQPCPDTDRLSNLYVRRIGVLESESLNCTK